MFKSSIGVFVSALLTAGLLSLGGIGGASAQSVMKQCGDDWKAAKAAGTTGGQSWKEFLAACRAKKEAAVAPAATPVAAPAPAVAPAPKPTPVAAAKPAPAPAKPAAAATGAGEFASEAEAKAKCPTDTIVWVNLGGKTPHKYHFAGSKYYGATKKGAYMCQADANAANAVAAKNEKAK